jgi:hypothetical protein
MNWYKQSQNNINPSVEDVGWHAGDLGKAYDTYLMNMGEGRSTGHYGTGTYFVSNKNKLQGIYKDRPHHQVDFSRYKLFKPKSTEDAYAIHNALKKLNSFILRKDVLELISGYEGVFNSRNVEERTSKYRNPLNHVVFELWLHIGNNLGINEQKIIDIIKNIANNISSQNKDFWNLKIDSASTMFMKALGYEGIDVRHLKSENGFESPDNVGYGSVIYDLKEKNNELV